MARGRNIKPAFFTNEDLADVEPLARLLFIGMWTIANFKGCFEYRPKRLKVQLLPYDDCDIEQLVNNLDKSRFISIYSVQGQRYIKVLNFTKHQNPHKNERDSGSDIPDIELRDDFGYENSLNVKNLDDNREKDGTTPDLNGIARADSLNLIPDSCFPITDTDTPETSVSGSDKPKRFCFKNELIKTYHCDPKLVDAFMAVRKTKKATNSEKAFELFVGKCSQSDLTMNQILEICIERDWKGFDISWLKNQNSGRGTDNFHDSFYGVGQSPFGKQESNSMRDVGGTQMIELDDVRF